MELITYCLKTGENKPELIEQLAHSIDSELSSTWRMHNLVWDVHNLLIHFARRIGTGNEIEMQLPMHNKSNLLPMILRILTNSDYGGPNSDDRRSVLTVLFLFGLGMRYSDGKTDLATFDECFQNYTEEGRSLPVLEEIRHAVAHDDVTMDENVICFVNTHKDGTKCRISFTREQLFHGFEEVNHHMTEMNIPRTGFMNPFVENIERLADGNVTICEETYRWVVEIGIGLAYERFGKIFDGYLEHLMSEAEKEKFIIRHLGVNPCCLRNIAMHEWNRENSIEFTKTGQSMNAPSDIFLAKLIILCDAPFVAQSLIIMGIGMANRDKVAEANPGIR